MLFSPGFFFLFLLLLHFFTPWKFFTSALADGLSLESEWQQVSSSLQDSSQYSGRSQQYCSLDCLHSSSYSVIIIIVVIVAVVVDDDDNNVNNNLWKNFAILKLHNYIY